MGCIVAPALAVVFGLAGFALTGVTALFMGVATILVSGLSGLMAFLMILI